MQIMILMAAADVNEDGHIHTHTHTYIHTYIHILTSFSMQIMMLMAAADVNEDGHIQYGEFAEVAVQLMLYVQKEQAAEEAAQGEI